MSLLKIVFVTAAKQIVIYGQGLRQLSEVQSYVLAHLGEVFKEMQQKVEMDNTRIYWIDDDGDKIEILNDVDYDIFLNRVGSTPKIYFQPKELDTENMIVHKTITCNVCKTYPIVGFRYKCLQCYNYDICMKCEREMKHKEHLMVRISTESLSYRNVQYYE